MTKIYYKSSLRSWTSRIIGLVILIMLVHIPRQAYAQWPPFSFRLTPTYSNGQITYHINFSNKAEWAMADITFKIPLPAGTRFLEASAPPSASVTFDGAEVTFFTAVPNQPLKDASFTVEVTDAALTIFTTHAWLVWKGDQPGDYLTEEVSIDIINPQQPLNWEEPARASVELEVGATVTDTIIAYTIYPTNVTGRRIWDLKVNVPLPEGTTFLAAEAPAPFVANFDGQEVSFSILELESRTETGPLRFTLSSDEAVTPFAVTHSWATWKNTGSSVGQSRPAQEDTRTGDIVVQPHTTQQVVADIAGDVPFSNYDLTSVALQEDRSALKITFYTAGSLGPVGEPLEFYLYIDSDCGADTGEPKRGLGFDYRVRYRHEKGQADIRLWQETEVVTEDTEADAEDEEIVVTTKGDWSKLGSIEEVINPADGQMVTVWVPYDLMDIGSQFCWLAEARNRTKAFTSNPPRDRIPNKKEDLRLTHYKVLSTATESAPAEPFTATAIYRGSNQADVTLVNNPSAPSTPPSITDLKGKLAVPIDNGLGFYDIHVFSMPDGQELTKLTNARQPNFRFDGQRLLINREGGGIENVYEYNLADGTERQVTDAPMDSHPFYDHWGNRVVYGNPELTVGRPVPKRDESGETVYDKNGEMVTLDPRKPFIFVQCGLLPPHQEAEPRCRDIPSLGVLVPAGQMGELQGTHPVWTSNDMIAYKGCNTWAGSQLCGIYIVPSSSTKGFSDGFIPRQLTQDTSDTPSDSKGNLIALTSYRDGNWEAYLMDLDGQGVKNLSNNPNSNDGLPTISPDEKWVAFVSDRDGQWAVWVVPVAGGSADRLFDLPQAIPWGNGDRAWQNERISWGP